MFCTVIDVELLLQIEISEPAAIESVERAIREVSAAIRNYTHQHLSLDTSTITLDGQGHEIVNLPELPVRDVIEVWEDNELLNAGDDYLLGQHGILYRMPRGRKWNNAIQSIEITYEHGYDPVPDDIVGVATRAAGRVFQAGLRSSASFGISGMAALGLGDYNVSFGAEAGGGVSEGVLGVSAARMLLLSEKDILNRYRHRTL